MDTKNPDDVERIELKGRTIESDGNRIWIHLDNDGLVQVRLSPTEVNVEILNGNDQEISSCQVYNSDLEPDPAT